MAHMTSTPTFDRDRPRYTPPPVPDAVTEALAVLRPLDDGGFYGSSGCEACRRIGYLIAAASDPLDWIATGETGDWSMCLWELDTDHHPARCSGRGVDSPRVVAAVEVLTRWTDLATHGRDVAVALLHPDDAEQAAEAVATLLPHVDNCPPCRSVLHHLGVAAADLAAWAADDGPARLGEARHAAAALGLHRCNGTHPTPTREALDTLQYWADELYTDLPALHHDIPDSLTAAIGDLEQV